MKKLVIAIAVMSLLASCGNSKKNKDEVVVTEEEVVLVPDTHNSRNSLDYKGTYRGEIPAADAAGIIVSVTLSDSTYVKTMKYIGKGDETFENKGKYTWNNEGNIVTLHEAGEDPDMYMVGENTLTMLDRDGNKITGDLADKYILKK